MNQQQTSPLKAASVLREWNSLIKSLGYVLKNVVSVVYTLNGYDRSECIDFIVYKVQQFVVCFLTGCLDPEGIPREVSQKSSNLNHYCLHV